MGNPAVSVYLIQERRTPPGQAGLYDFIRVVEHTPVRRGYAASLRDFQSFVILQLVELISLPLERRPTLILDFHRSPKLFAGTCIKLFSPGGGWKIAFPRLSSFYFHAFIRPGNVVREFHGDAPCPVKISPVEFTFPFRRRSSFYHYVVVVVVVVPSSRLRPVFPLFRRVFGRGSRRQRNGRDAESDRSNGD